MLSYFGATMFYFRVPFFDVVILSSDWTPLVTVLWLLGMTQAINLIDGLDGLATGIVAIGAFAFFLYSQHLSEEGLLTQPNIGPLNMLGASANLSTSGFPTLATFHATWTVKRWTPSASPERSITRPRSVVADGASVPAVSASPLRAASSPTTAAS